MLHTVILVALSTVPSPLPPSNPPPSPFPPTPPSNPPPSPSPPPRPPLDVFTSNDALLGCTRAQHKVYHNWYNYGYEDFSTHYKVVQYNDTGLHDLSVNVDKHTCAGEVTVGVVHGKTGHVVSLFTSETGDAWTLVANLTLVIYDPPPPSPSPPPPSPMRPPPPSPFPPPPAIILRRLQEETPSITYSPFNGADMVRLLPFAVSRAPMYVRTCIDCDGTCNGIDHIDAIVSCYYANYEPPPPLPSDPPLPWWVWLFAGLAGVFLLVSITLFFMNRKQAVTAPAIAPRRSAAPSATQRIPMRR